jgi:hypothetical protein
LQSSGSSEKKRKKEKFLLPTIPAYYYYTLEDPDDLKTYQVKKHTKAYQTTETTLEKKMKIIS